MTAARCVEVMRAWTPEARAALVRFQESYAELSKQRRRPEAAHPDRRTLEALRSLGYVDGQTPTGPTAVEELELPPPGLG